MPRWKAALFDVGDTLIHFDATDPRRLLRLAGEPFHCHLRNHGVPIPDLEVYLRHLKHRFVFAYLWSKLTRREVQMAESIVRAHRRMGVCLDLDQTRLFMDDCADAIRNLFRPDADASPTIDILHSAGLKLGLVSNTWIPGASIDGFLADAGLLEYFPVRIYSSEVHSMKPGRRIFRLALNRLHVTADETVFIGDRPEIDIRGARRMGLGSVWIARRTPRRMRARPDHTIHRLSELPALFGLRSDAPRLAEACC